MNTQLVRGAALSYVGIALAIASGLTMTPLLVRYLGRSDYALFALTTSVVTLLAFDLGLNSAVARFVATYEARQDRDSTLKVLGIVRRVYVMLDVILFVAVIVVWAYAERLFPALTSEEVARFRTSFLIVGLMMLASFPLQPANGTLQGLERFVVLRGSDVVWRALGIATVVVVLVADLGLFWLVFGASCITLGVGVYRACVCWSAGVWRWRFPRESAELRKEVASYTSWSFFVALAQRFMLTLMPGLLAALSGTAAVASFTVAALIEGYVWLIANAVNGLFLPRVARLVLKEDLDAIHSLMERVGRFQLVVLTLFIGGFVVFGSQFIRHWLGPGFGDVYVVCLLLILPTLVTHSQEVTMSMLIAKGEVRFRALCTAIAAVVNLLAALMLAPTLGALGGGISVALGTVVGYIIAMNIVYARVIGFNVLRFFNSVHRRVLIGPAMLVAAFLLLGRIWSWDSLGEFVLGVVLFVIGYAGIMWTGVLSASEKNLVRGLAKGPREWLNSKSARHR